MASKTERSAKKSKSPEKEVELKTESGMSRVKEFAADVKSEFGKVVWPPKKQTFASTGVVIVLVMIISFYLGAVDLILGKLIGLVLR